MSMRFRVIFSCACAVLIALLCAGYASHVRDEAERVRQESIERYGGEVVTLVVATEGLEAGEVVGYANVTERDWLVDLAPEGAISSVDDALGARVTVPVAAGAPVCELNLRDDSAMPDVPAGMVAVSLPLTDKLGLSRGVASGAKVIAFEVTDDGAQLISDDVQVVMAPTESSGLSTSAVVTVAAPPDDVSALLAASASGDLRLAMPASNVHMDRTDADAEGQEGFDQDVTDVPAQDGSLGADEASDVPSEEVDVADEAADEEADA